MTDDAIALAVLLGFVLCYAIGRSASLVQSQELRARAFATGFEEGLKLGAEEERRRIVRNVLRPSDSAPDFIGAAGPVREIADALELQREHSPA